jgi:hypothetical protein
MPPAAYLLMIVHPWQMFYNTLFKRNSVFVSTVFLSAFTFSIGYDLATTAWWDAHNRGVSQSLHVLSCWRHGMRVAGVPSAVSSVSRPCGTAEAVKPDQYIAAADFQKQWKDIRAKYQQAAKE